ncbi:hypothetical protein KOW79_013024 [Hemibagrus wyckioides]|uniref:Uncharacterized protein n=1 Tax=Hemibagrus wyckioides TaxID=337641 RepID=A0A9D3NJC9_9TELE|nr:hypothetical protein KOW79_013024 [Hemibagrus wyckioides]
MAQARGLCHTEGLGCCCRRESEKRDEGRGGERGEERSGEERGEDGVMQRTRYLENKQMKKNATTVAVLRGLQSTCCRIQHVRVHVLVQLVWIIPSWL